MYNTLKINNTVQLLPSYQITYNYNPSWELQRLICHILDMPGHSRPYIPSGAKLVFANHPNPDWVILLFNHKVAGVIPKKVLDDYSSKGFIKWNAFYWVHKGKPSLWIELK